MALVCLRVPAAGVMQEKIDVWVDNVMRGGDDWDAEIKRKLSACDVFILLVSPHSLASEYILKTEIETIKQRQQNKEDVRMLSVAADDNPEICARPGPSLEYSSKGT